MHDTEEIIKVFHDLKKIGVKLALDDFGTGYSSFGYMKDLPLDIMKLDRSLISDIVMDEREQMIVSTMIKIIHGLGLEVVVEGVETKEQYEQLKQYDCDYIQGYLFSRPLPADEFVKYYRFMKKNEHPANYVNDSISNAGVRVAWQKEWNSGNDMLDRQHRSLMQTANQLVNSWLKGINDDWMLAEIDELIHNLTEHFEFEYEGNILREIEFYDCSAHLDTHRRLLEKAQELRTAFAQGKIKSWLFFSFVIDDFISAHLKEEDMKFFPYFK